MVMSMIIFFVYVPGGTIFKELFKGIKMTNLGLYHGLILIFGLSFFTSDRVAGKAGKWLLGLLLYLSFLFIIMAEVRAAWAGLLVALVLMGFLLKKEMKIFILIFLLMIPSFLIIDYFDLGVQKNKLDSLKEQVTTVAKRRVHTMPAANIKWRLSIWRQTIKEIREYPVFGWGYGTQIDYIVWKQRLSWLKAIGANTGVLPPHNHLLAITYKMGILGLLLFLFINFMVFFRGLFYIKKCKSDFNRRFLIASLAGLVYWHGMAFFFDVLESPPTGIFLWILLAVILAIVKTDKSAEESN
jgi:O-antigen ligase